MDYKDLVYIDIETAGFYPDLSSLKENDIRGYDLFMRKIERKSPQFLDWKEDPNDVYLNKSPLIPEFGRVVCVSMARVTKNDEIKMMSVCNEDEEYIIKQTQKSLMNVSNNSLLGLSGFYIKGFDIPWLNRKMLKYGYIIPKIIKTHSVKPWEMNVADLAEVWKSLGTLEIVSFDEMLYTLGIDSPKDIMAGKDVHKYFWKTKELDKIQTYCEGDVMGCIKAAKKIVHLI